MIRLMFILTAFSVAMASAIAAEEADFTHGILWVNEDWYGHQNSSVNYLMPDADDGIYWKYRIIRSENPGMEPGCTNQYGALWNGRLYLIAKQDKDPGADITGGRITVADARTMKILHQQSLIDPSGAQCDGRAFVGVDPHKGYISTSNGVWIFDLDTYTVTGQVDGTANPNAGGNGDKLRMAVTGGTCRRAAIPGIDVAGKTGTAQNPHGRDHSAFMGFAPYDDPKIAVAVYVENAGFGAVYGVPIGSLVMEKYLTGQIAESRQYMEDQMLTSHLHYDPNAR